MAHWLDTVCYPFDHAILEAIHNFTLSTGGFFTLLLEIITFFANDGLGMIFLGLVLCCFAKSRRVGMTVLFSVACGALITNVALKNIVVRPRPYADITRDIHQWWVYITEHSFFKFTVSDHSFPSGHTTATVAAMSAVFLTTDKKKSWPVFIFAALMGFSRMYLMVHYPTDVLAGLLAGALGAVGGYFLVKLLYRVLEKRRDNKLVGFYYSFDVIALFKGKKEVESAADSEESPETGRENKENDENSPKGNGK